MCACERQPVGATSWFCPQHGPQVGSIRAEDLPLIQQAFAQDVHHAPLCSGKSRDRRGGKPGDHLKPPGDDDEFLQMGHGFIKRQRRT